MSTKIYDQGFLVYFGRKGKQWYKHKFKVSQGPAIGADDKQSVRMGNLILSKAARRNAPKKKRKKR
jgi:hypothetical protein